MILISSCFQRCQNYQLCQQGNRANLFVGAETMALLNGEHEIRVVISVWDVSDYIKKTSTKIKYKNLATVRTTSTTGWKMNG